MTHLKLLPRERVGMWSTILAAVTAGWPETMRLIVVLVVIAFLVYGVFSLTHQPSVADGIVSFIISHFTALKPR